MAVPKARAATPKTTDHDMRHMAAALALACRGLGRTWPNPTVGCVVVRDGHVVGRAVTCPGGRPHAETEALRMAGPAAKGATVYVTLEPCAHQGATPSCADALVEAGIERAVVALRDPDLRTAGKGVARLRAAGIEVAEGLGEADARDVNAGFLSRIARGRPLTTIKVAASLDGRVAAPSGESRWLTGQDARRRGHMLRARHDAIMIGIGTALADDPELSCRLPGMESASPLCIVVDSGLRLPLSSRLVQGCPERPLWVACGTGAGPARARALEEHGVTVIPIRRDDDGRVGLAALLQELGERGLTRLLIEGGPTLATAMFRNHLVDHLAWFSAPMMLGGMARPALDDLGLIGLADAVTMKLRRLHAAGEDMFVLYDIVGRGAA